MGRNDKETQHFALQNSLTLGLLVLQYTTDFPECGSL